MATFKVKYPTRRKLEQAIKQVIVDEGLTDTYALLNSVKISAVEGDFTNINITINAIYYYMFLDKGASLWNGGVIAPFDITNKALNSSMGKSFLDDVVTQYFEWLNETYPLLSSGRIITQPKFTYQYNLYGDPDGSWNGTFN